MQRQEEEEEVQAKVQRQEEEEEVQAKIQRQEEEEEVQAKLQRQEEEEEVATAPSGSQDMAVSADLEKRIESARGNGRPLPESVRAPVEPQFGHDLSGVQLHTDANADNLSQELNARAFTTGNDIFFRDGEYKPDSEEGIKLLSHELTHVVQQGAAPLSRQTEEKTASAEDKEKDEAQAKLQEAENKAMSSMSETDVKELLEHAARLQQLGSEEAAQKALNEVSEEFKKQLDAALTKFQEATNSNKEAAKQVLNKAALVQMLDADSTEAETAVNIVTESQTEGAAEAK